MRVNFVQVANAREEPASLDREAVVEPQCLEVRLFDIDAVVAVDRGRNVRVEIGIDIRGDSEFRFAEIEAALARTLAPGRRNEARDAIGRRILRETRVVARENHRYGRIERGRITGLSRSGRNSGLREGCWRRGRCHGDGAGTLG